MGDRNNPIKFGPEWLRNLARERSAGSTASNNQNSGAVAGAGGGGAAAGSPGGATSSLNALANTANALPKVQLAKLRYGREEMLALYDRTSEAPQELKYIDLLYQPRGKPPVALNNTFEDEMRETMRTGPPIGGMSPGERFGIGRGMGRGINVSEGRGRARTAFARQPSTGRGWHLGNPRMPGYSGGVDDESSQALRSWNNSNNGGNVAARSSGEQTEWTPNKMFRSKRPGTNTNWRQATRDDGEEWRGSDTNRSRPNQQEKWERDWGERPNQDKQQSWNTNRRTWGGDAQNNDDNLPEWAVENAEACGGTFDSSGAFHGYSNDDTNLPKTAEPAYALTRSHTHGSFARSKTVEEGSEEWWASEKAKKLSPKRFDASDIKFKKQGSGTPESNPSTSLNTKSTTSKEDIAMPKVLDKPESSSVAPEPPENNANSLEDSFNKKNFRFVESKTFDALMRSDINLEEANDERGNFQSVMITPNNSLRQKHQNIVASVNSNTNRQIRKPGILQLLQTAQSSSSAENEHSKKHQSSEEKMVDEFMDLTLEEKEILTNLTPSEERSLMNPPTSVMSPGMSTVVSQMSNPAMQLRMTSPVHPSQGLTMNKSIPTPGVQSSAGMQTPGIKSVGINNFALSQAMGIPLQGIPPPVLPNQGMGNPGMGNPGMGGPVMQTAGGSGIPGFQSTGGIPGMTGPSVGNNPLLYGQSGNNSSLHSSNDIHMPNHGNQTNMFPMHGLQHSGSQTAFGSSIYGNIIPSSPAPSSQNSQSLVEQWYYEDPEKNIQGPFSSKDMYNWYRAGFFSPSLMVRRACDNHMRPLGSYGPMVPFAQMDMMSSFPMPGGYERNQGPHDTMTSSQQSLGMDVINMSNRNMTDTNAMESMQFGTVGLMRSPPFGQQQMVDSLWSQSSPSPDLMWMQQALNARNETRVNNLPMFFWDQQPSAIASNSLLPEEIAKEMKTEDQILAQLRASQNFNTPQKKPFLNEQPVVNANKPEDAFTHKVNKAPNLEELQKLIREDSLRDAPPIVEPKVEIQETQTKAEKIQKDELVTPDSNSFTSQQPVQNKVVNDVKPAKQSKNETEKAVKNKENNNTKTKNKKTKEEKKEDLTELKNTEESIKTEKRSEEPSPSKVKKEEKLNKKDLEKEKKEWIKDGFTIVKGSDKNTSKDSKKKMEDVKAVEEAERKRKEEERLAAEEEKKRKQAEAVKKQQEVQQHQQRQVSEAIIKKAPWSAVANQALQATNKDGLTLAEIQRLEREKKLEQMKEQQQMMQIIAQQQAAALAREQEMQAGLGWAKKKGNNVNSPGQSLAEIQAEARKQAAFAAAAAVQIQEEIQAPPPPPQINHAPWGNTQNGGGFWDPQPSQPQKQQESPKIEQNKSKKKITLNLPVKKEISPAAEFETWCTTVLASWSAKIDVPTFVGFLKDIESPYEVKDYVKCYLGESKDTSDFARQFLERRSKLLRVGMVTPSDDLCSPAMAVNPRTVSGSDYQEVKGKVKKTKKNKMLKVDARILGFSVTAAEDRINVGDIDTA